MEECLIDVKPKNSFYKIKLEYKIIDLQKKNYLYPEKNQEFFALKRTKFGKDISIFFTKQGSVFKTYEKAKSRAVFLLNRGFMTSILEIIEKRKNGGSK